MNDTTSMTGQPQLASQSQTAEITDGLINSGVNAATNGVRREAAAEANAADKVISRVGQLTRMLHDSLRELGYNKCLQKAAASIPDAQDRLAYVAVMTKQAAERALNATESAKPIQDQLAADATGLSQLWQQQFDSRACTGSDSGAYRDLVAQTRRYLDDIPNRTAATNAQLLEIMMAQDFQDLTGQVIKKITEVVQNLEQELVQLLVDSVPPEKKREADTELMNGPVVNPVGRNDVVTSQNQVDDLLASLGF